MDGVMIGALIMIAVGTIMLGSVTYNMAHSRHRGRHVK